MKIDFTKWTDAQLNSTPESILGSHLPLAMAEIQRRKDAGIWLTDGSTERVAAMIRNNTPATRRKLARRATR